MEEILKKAIAALESNLENKGSYAQFNNFNYKPIKLDESNFKPLETIDSNKKIAFLDGGNAEIIASPNFSLQFIRIYYTVYQNNKRIASEKKEFYVLITSKNQEQDIIFETEIFPINYNFKNQTFNSFDSTLREGNNRVSISKIGNTIRRFAELSIAKEIDSEIIVLDGDLKSRYTGEQAYLDELYQSGKIIAALSKTNELFTETGNNFNVVLDDLASLEEWAYYPIVEINDEKHKAQILMVKLNKDSKYIFKLEIDKKENINELLSLLKDNSKDPIFFGYPYALVEADKHARVPNNEKDYLKTKLMALAGNKWASLAKYLNTKNAHDILDNIG